MKSAQAAEMLERIGDKLIDTIISHSGICHICHGTLLGLRINSVVECVSCNKTFRRTTDQDETYYVELIRAH